VFDLGLAQALDSGARAALKAARPIVVTGATDPRSRALAVSLEASDYLVKPVEAREVLPAKAGHSVYVEGLNAYYGQNHAVKNLSITFPANEVTAIIGPSGCGKSTLLNVAAGLLAPRPATPQRSGWPKSAISAAPA